MPQIGVATFTISVFHSWHETAFDLAVIRRVSRYNGGRHDKLRSGGQGNKRTRGRSSPSTRHRQGEPLRFTVLHRKRPRHDVRWRRRRHAHGDGARAAFPKRRERDGRLVRFASAFAGRNEREDSRTGGEIQGIRRPERADYTKHCKQALCAKGLRVSSGFLIIGETKFRCGL